MKLVYSKNEIYKPRYFIYNYNNSYFRLIKIKNCRLSGFEEIKHDTNDFIDLNSNEVQRASLSRTKKNIREICLCNDFEYFATLTINSNCCDRYNLQIVQDKLKKTLKKIKRKNSNLGYIFITEKHKDGAFHFHGLIKGITDLYTNENGYLCSRILSNEIGYNSFSPIRDYNKCCNYITKYITKDCVKNEHNQIYISSRGLKKAERTEITPFSFKPSFSNDYVDILDFNPNEIDKISLLNLLSIKNKEGFFNFLSNNKL